MEALILFLPLAGALACGFGWRLLQERMALGISTALVFASMALSWVAFFSDYGDGSQIELARWIDSGTFSSEWSLRIDRLTQIMLVVVTSVSAFVHLYSWGYMAHDPEWREGESYRPRFFAYLSFFTFAMLALVTSDNLLQLFFGWEGVGLASYLLIGFYYRRPSASAAAIKAFIVNRVGDVGFALGIFGLYMMVDSVRLEDIFASAPDLAASTLPFLWMEVNAAELLALLLFVGAMGKSAQFLLHTWLPDAMEGPTPVSALIHAATMVTAGVFLVCRMSPLFEVAPLALSTVAAVGAATALFAATVGLVQNDIKRVIAYSTCSQLGYMFVAAGVGVYQVAMFHLFTHAFFKALLFLGAGSVIHAMHHEQDMRVYGGLRRKIPLTFWSMMIGTLAITGVGIPLTHFGLAGFLSKDAIIESAYAAHGAVAPVAFWTLVAAAALTSFYSWRLMLMTFFGEPRGNPKTHAHASESPWTMTVPLAALAAGSVFSGVVWYHDFFGDHVKEFFGGSVFTAESNHVLHDAHYVPAWVKASPFVAMLAGLGAAYLFYVLRPGIPAALARQQWALHRFLLNKWYFDEAYDFLFVRPAKALGLLLWRRGDIGAIDGFLNGVAMGLVPFLTRLLSRLQSGYLYTYAFAMVLGLGLLVTWLLLGGL